MRKQHSAKPIKAAPERLQKVLAEAGLGSRRALEAEIQAGQVMVNSKVARLGQKVSAGDRVEYRQRRYDVIPSALEARTLVYNKPEGEVTTRNDPEGRPTVFDRLPRLRGARWIAIGRLDINTTGLLLLTTDGELANAMMHPSNQVDREYVCRVWGDITAEQLEQLRQGVELDDGPARFTDIQAAPNEEMNETRNHWFYVVLLEGRNREVRRLWEAVGAQVNRLKRVRYGAAQLTARDRLGKFRELSPREHQILREDVKLPGSSVHLRLEAIRGRTAGRRTMPAPRGGKSHPSRDSYQRDSYQEGSPRQEQFRSQESRTRDEQRGGYGEKRAPYSKGPNQSPTSAGRNESSGRSNDNRPYAGQRGDRSLERSRDTQGRGGNTNAFRGKTRSGLSSTQGENDGYPQKPRNQRDAQGQRAQSQRGQGQREREAPWRGNSERTAGSRDNKGRGAGANRFSREETKRGGPTVSYKKPRGKGKPPR